MTLTAKSGGPERNEATTFVTTADLMVGGKHVPAGNYTLYTIPNQQQWTLIINKQTGTMGNSLQRKAGLGAGSHEGR